MPQNLSTHLPEKCVPFTPDASWPGAHKALVQSSETEPCSYDTGDSWDQRQTNCKVLRFPSQVRSNRDKTHSRTPRHTPVLAEVTSGVGPAREAGQRNGLLGPGEAGVWRRQWRGAGLGARRRAGTALLLAAGGGPRTGLGGWATEGASWTAGSPDPARPSSSRGGDSAAQESCLYFLPSPLASRPPRSGRPPLAPSPHSARAARMAGPRFGLWVGGGAATPGRHAMGTAAGRSASDSCKRASERLRRRRAGGRPAPGGRGPAPLAPPIRPGRGQSVPRPGLEEAGQPATLRLHRREWVSRSGALIWRAFRKAEKRARCRFCRLERFLLGALSRGEESGRQRVWEADFSKKRAVEQKDPPQPEHTLRWTWVYCRRW